MQLNKFIFEAIKDVNAGLTFKRDGKSFSIEQISKQELNLKFISKASLTDPTSYADTLARKKNVSEIKKMMLPYIK